MKYIDAEKLIAEIESIINSDHPIEYKSMEKQAYNSALNDAINFIDSLRQEQPEVQNGKFVFPKYLYARTKDNKTIDMSYAPQNMTAVEYIRNDFAEQPEVNLEKEIDDYYYENINSIIGTNDTKKVVEDTASHFYELGLKARKED